MPRAPPMIAWLRAACSKPIAFAGVVCEGLPPCVALPGLLQCKNVLLTRVLAKCVLYVHVYLRLVVPLADAVLARM